MRDRIIFAVCRHRHVLRACVMCLAIVHPLIHGTPLDGGVIDSMQAQLGAAWGALQ